MDPKLVDMFRRVDKDNSGSIKAEELQACLSNGLGTAFDITCASLMISLFDQDNSGTISLNEFGQLYNYVTQWQSLFQQHDRDASGSIDPQELASALRHFGYSLSPNFINWLFGRFDRQRMGKLGFDKYVYILVCLQILTNGFRRLDVQQRGMASMSFEQFLSAAFNMCV